MRCTVGKLVLDHAENEVLVSLFVSPWLSQRVRQFQQSTVVDRLLLYLFSLGFNWLVDKPLVP